MLRPCFFFLFFRIITHIIIQTNLSGGNVCLNIDIDLRTNQVEDKDEAEATLKKLLNLIDRHHRSIKPILSRFQK